MTLNGQLKSSDRRINYRRLYCPYERRITMANWILLSRDSTGHPIVSAMAGSAKEESLSSHFKADLIGFLQLFSDANTFLVGASTRVAVDIDPEVEAIQLLSQADRSPMTSHNVSPSGTWFNLFRDRGGQPVTVAVNGAHPVELYRGNLTSGLIEFLTRHSGANTFQIAPDGSFTPEGVPQWKPSSRPHRQHRVMLEIGHGPGSSFDPGAIAHDGQTTEHELNIMAANSARNVIAAHGVDCTVIDTAGSLHSIGLQSSGFDVFCSIHHNAFNGNVQRAEAFSHQEKGELLDSQLAELISKELSATLNIPNGGAKQARFGVLSGSEDTNVRASVLAEVYFIDFRGNSSLPRPNLTDFSTRGGEAVGRAILAWLNQNP